MNLNDAITALNPKSTDLRLLESPFSGGEFRRRIFAPNLAKPLDSRDGWAKNDSEIEKTGGNRDLPRFSDLFLDQKGLEPYQSPSSTADGRSPVEFPGPIIKPIRPQTHPSTNPSVPKTIQEWTEPMAGLRN